MKKINYEGIIIDHDFLNACLEDVNTKSGSGLVEDYCIVTSESPNKHLQHLYGTKVYITTDAYIEDIKSGRKYLQVRSIYTPEPELMSYLRTLFDTTQKCFLALSKNGTFTLTPNGLRYCQMVECNRMFVGTFKGIPKPSKLKKVIKFLERYI